MLADRYGVPFPPIRRLGPQDLKHCVALSVDRGWSPEESKWSLLLEVAEVFGVDAPDGGLAGSVVLTRYEPGLASVGMMLVAARHGRLGLGRALMEHLLAEAGDATVTLFATDLGKPLYMKLGFRTIGRNVSFAGTFRGDYGMRDNSNMRVRLAAEADMAAILDVDREAFGADRSHILRRLPRFALQLRVLESESGITGFAAAWRNETSTVIGPIVAPDAAAARRLVTELAVQVPGPVRLDLDPDRPGLAQWALSRGLQPRSGNAVMAHGAWNPRGNPDRLFAPVSVALA